MTKVKLTVFCLFAIIVSLFLTATLNLQNFMQSFADETADSAVMASDDLAGEGGALTSADEGLQLNSDNGVTLMAAHTHSWGYNLNDKNQIVATCSNEDGACDSADGGYIGFVTKTDYVYSGTAVDVIENNLCAQLAETFGVTYQYSAESQSAAVAVNSIKNAGEYTATLTLGDKQVQAAFVVSGAPLNITAGDATITFGEEAANSGVTYSGFIQGEDEKICLSGTLQYTYSYSKGDDVGEYSIDIIGLSGDNYNITYVSGKLKVQKYEISVAINDATSAYGSQLAELTASVVSPTTFDEDVYGKLDNIILLTTKAQSLSNAGTYAITAVTIDGNFAVTVTKNGTYTITKAKNAINGLSINSWEYGKTANSPVAISTYGSIIYTYSQSKEGPFTSIVPTKPNAYYVKAEVAATDNYEGATSIVSFNVNKKVVMRPAKDLTSFVYDGTEKTYFVETSTYYTVTGNKRTDVGSNNVIISLIDKDDYIWDNNQTADLSYSFTVNKSTQNAFWGTSGSSADWADWVIVALVCILIVELIVANIFWKEHCKHTFAFAPIALLAAVAAWKIVLIAVLAVAIWLVGIYNICAFKKFKGKYNDTAVYDAEYPPEYAAQYIFLTHQLERKSVVEPSYSMYIPEKSTTEAGNELQDNRGNSYYIPDRQGTIVTPPPEDEIRRRSIITPPIKQDEKVAQPIVVAEPEMLKLSLSEAAEAGEPIEIVDDDGEIREVIRSVDATTGYAIIVGYSRSFLSRLIQSSDETKYYYSSLKNKILSYTDARARMWWNFDSIMFGRNVIAKFGFRDKTLCMYFALDADMYTAQYKVEKIQSKRYEEVPCMARIKNDKRKAVAEALIEELAKKFGMTANKIHNEDYYYPYDTTAALIEKGLIKEVVKRELYEEYRTRHNLSDGEDPYIEDESTSPMETYDSSTRPVNEEIRQLMAPHNYDYLSQSATEEMNGEPYVDEVESELDLLDNGPIEDGQPVPEVKHTKPGKPKKTEKPEKEEKAEEKPKKPRAKKKPEEVEVHVVEHVNIKEADEMLSNDDAEVLVDDESVGRPIGRNKYAINVDTLSKNFKAKEHVTLQSLKDKNLLPAKADSFKVLARGVLDKPLIVEADAYSIEAVKMIVLTGGKVIKV